MGPEIRALIVDDEPLARRGVRQLLAVHPDIVVAGECRNGREALRAFETLSPDLVFLDVQMPGLDGFGVLTAWRNRPMPFIVFVTAFDEFAVRAFETHALDYLVKPLAADRFDRTMQRVRERMRLAEAGALAQQLSSLLGSMSGPQRRGERIERAPSVPWEQRITVPTEAGQLVLHADDIEWIEARDYYAGVHAGSRRHLVRESLASLEKRLDPARFLRVHRSAIVRMDLVRELRQVDGDETVAILLDGTRIPVSRRRRERLATLLRSTSR